MEFRLTFHIQLVSFKNIDISLIYGPITIKFGAYAQMCSVTAPSLLGNCYLENSFHKNIRVNLPQIYLPPYKGHVAQILGEQVEVT